MTTFEKAMANNTQGVTKINFREVETRKGKCWCFDAYYNREYPNFTSAPVKTNKGIVRNAVKYLLTGEV